MGFYFDNQSLLSGYHHLERLVYILCCILQSNLVGKVHPTGFSVAKVLALISWLALHLGQGVQENYTALKRVAAFVF